MFFSLCVSVSPGSACGPQDRRENVVFSSWHTCSAGCVVKRSYFLIVGHVPRRELSVRYWPLPRFEEVLRQSVLC